jgi:hypothetical protein
VSGVMPWQLQVIKGVKLISGVNVIMAEN